jgi:hypothetical protein
LRKAPGIAIGVDDNSPNLRANAVDHMPQQGFSDEIEERFFPPAHARRLPARDDSGNGPHALA